MVARLEDLCRDAVAAGEADGDWAVVGLECVMCMEAPRGTRLRPCCHALLCAGCAADLMRRGSPICPTCRTVVERWEEGVFPATYAPA